MAVKFKDIKDFLLGDGKTPDNFNGAQDEPGQPDEGTRGYKSNFISTLGCITFIILIFIINFLLYALYKVWG